MRHYGYRSMVAARTHTHKSLAPDRMWTCIRIGNGSVDVEIEPLHNRLQQNASQYGMPYHIIYNLAYIIVLYNQLHLCQP